MLTEVIGLNPNLIAEAGAYTLGGVELAKRYLPDLFPAGKSGTRSVLLPCILGIVSALTGVGPFAGISWASAAVQAALGAAGAGMVHDKVAPVVDPWLDKLPGQKKG